MLSDIYTSNPDGIGIMYATTKGLKVTKVLPKSIADASQFISKLPNDDRELAIHFRWTTHGHTNMENCHPYDVVKGYVGMMHNGVLHTGNAADKAKSDTWHFINDYLASPVAEHPPLVHNEKFLDMIAEFIGDNRFVFMDGEGKMSHVNYDQGVEHDGMWFSNTYAWKPSRLIPHYQSSYKYASRYTGMYGSAYDYDDEYGGYKTLPSHSWKSDTETMGTTRKLSAHDPHWSEDDYEYADDAFDFPSEEGAMLNVEDLEELLLNANVDELQACLEVIPATTTNMLFKHFKGVPTVWTKAKDLAAYEAVIYHALLAEDTDGIYAELEKSKHDIVAEVMAYYLNWERKHAPVTNTLPALLS
jgi:predicted glutamine amidotransferase